MITEVAPRIFALDIPLPGNPLKNLNSYLIIGNERNLLIDTGFNMPESLEAMKACLAALRVDMAETDIFLTHLHSDHIGLAPSIAHRMSRVYMSSIDRGIMLRFRTREYRDKINRAFLMFGFTPEELKENRTVNPAIVYLPKKEVFYTALEDGYVLDLGDRRLRCILTPGHTPGHFCLYDPDERILFSGDHIIFGISPNITSWADLPDALGSYLESLEAMKALSVRRTFSSHRQVEGDLYTRIDELLLHHRHRLDEAYDAVRILEKATVYETASRMTWSIRAKNWADFPVAQKWFAVGEAHAHLEYLRLRSRITMNSEGGLLYYFPK